MVRGIWEWILHNDPCMMPQKTQYSPTFTSREAPLSGLLEAFCILTTGRTFKARPCPEMIKTLCIKYVDSLGLILGFRGLGLGLERLGSQNSAYSFIRCRWQYDPTGRNPKQRAKELTSSKLAFVFLEAVDPPETQQYIKRLCALIYKPWTCSWVKSRVGC